ncbi:hypothetical protein OPV22_025824 [Ensete ventricosum]|uniref:Late embryogenesis abundant protein LEA-2 subgroup domain-containing protein n=1 Tax=Ensete ventricosum TaxID=4639 RepID=A0AAV8P7W4_ENSVE|nr:hypothetical protein OPV22_025824 [Ensete ventricosum]
MMHAKSESDVTSLAASATPVSNSPMESPSHPSFGRHSRSSSASRFSGPFRSSSGRKGYRKRVNDNGWPECNVIQEEGSYDDLDEDKGLSRRCQIILALLSFLLLFTVFSLIIWGTARPYKPDVIVKSLWMDDFLHWRGYRQHRCPNQDGHKITITTEELQKYYQPRKSHRTVSVVLHGEKVPLYGAGAGLALSSTGGEVPLTLDFDIISRGYVIGKLVRVKHRKHITCSLVVDSSKNKPIKFAEHSCTYT